MIGAAPPEVEVSSEIVSLTLVHEPQNNSLLPPLLLLSPAVPVFPAPVPVFVPLPPPVLVPLAPPVSIRSTLRSPRRHRPTPQRHLRRSCRHRQVRSSQACRRRRRRRTSTSLSWEASTAALAAACRAREAQGWARRLARAGGGCVSRSVGCPGRARRVGSGRLRCARLEPRRSVQDMQLWCLARSCGRAAGGAVVR